MRDGGGRFPVVEISALTRKLQEAWNENFAAARKT